MAESPSTLIAQLRALHALTDTETAVARTRRHQARTDAVATALTRNADNARDRADSIGRILRERGHSPTVLGPLFGRVAAAVKSVTEQAQSFDEALLGDLALEHQLLDRSRYLRALAAAGHDQQLVELADRLIGAHAATVQWLTTVLAEVALGGPAALRRTPTQAATGAAMRWLQAPASWSARSLDGAVEATRSSGAVIGRLIGRGAHAGEIAARTITAGGAAALTEAERVTRGEGADTVADALHDVRTTTGTLDPQELPVADYDTLTVPVATAAIKELTDPAEIRAIITYEEAHKNRNGVVSAAESRLAVIAEYVAGIR